MIKLKEILFEGKLTEAEKVMYVVALENGEVMSGDKAVSEKKALQIMSRISKQSDGWVNPFMIGVKYWNGTHPKRKGKPHKSNKKKIMVKEAKVSLSLIKKAAKAAKKGKNVVVYDQRNKKYKFQDIAGKSGGTIAVSDKNDKPSSWKTLPHSLIKKIVIEGKLNEAKETIFDVAARVLKNKSMEVYKAQRGKVKLDMQTANLLVKVWKKINPKMKKYLSDLGYKDPAQLVQTLWAVVK